MRTQRHCPICNHCESDLLKSISFYDFDKILPSLYHIVSCNHCGFVFDDFDATEKTFQYYYQQQNKYETPGIVGGGILSAIEQNRFDFYSDLIERHLDKEATIIDIGAGQGGFLKVLKHRGYKHLMAVDPSPNCVQSIKEYGLAACCATLETFTSTQQFDLVSLTGVLEHLYDIQIAIKRIARLIKPGGYLFVDVPDASEYSTHFLAPYYRYDQEHINHFSKHHLTNLMSWGNAQPVEIIQKEMPFAKYHPMPSLLGLYSKKESETELFTESSIKPDFQLKQAIVNDLIISRKEDCLSFNNEGNVSTAIWGIGAHTLRLLEESDLLKCNIRYFVDNNPHKTGKSIQGIPIISSSYFFDVMDKIDHVFIGSVLYGKEMAETLLNKGYKGQINLLYPH